jgi:hypothetical protein
MKSYWDILPDDLQKSINEHRAAIKIQNKTIKIFHKKYGENWKQIIRQNKLVYNLDYYCYRMGINDPWYDYSDNPKYAY